MREYQKLCDELKKKSEELKSLSSDPARESELKTEIELLKEEIVTFPCPEEQWIKFPSPI